MVDWTAMTDPTEIIAVLDRLSRSRALSLEESKALEKAIKLERAKMRRGSRWWSPEQDRLALELKSRKAKVGVIARQLGRSKDAVYARIRLLEQRQSAPCVGRRG